MRSTFGQATGLFWAVGLLVVLGSAAPAGAYQASDGPGVARISVLRGTVAIKHGDAGDTVAAAINAPLLVGDYLTTAADSRAEVQFDYDALARVGPDAQLRFTQLDPTQHTLQLAAGSVELRIFGRTDAHPEIETPSVTVRPVESGRYRITVTGDGNTEITVRAGRAEIVSPQGTRELDPGGTLLVQGDATAPEFRDVATVAYDDFDRWNDERDGAIGRSLSHRYVGDDVIGADDLDRYGHWVDVADYGEVWSPNAGAGWAPYRDGRWVWEDYYGWTWVGNEPWGWAPYHYGRWFYANRVGWCWYPGAIGFQPIWQPALVGFFTFGSGSFNVSFGNIGWVPLGPFETFSPWWGPSFGNRIIVNNITNITNVYQNGGAPGGVTAVPVQNFGGGGVLRRELAVKPAELRRVGVVRGVVPVVPTERSRQLTDRPLAPATRTALGPRLFHSFAPPPQPISFAQQRRTIERLTPRTTQPSRAPVKPLTPEPVLRGPGTVRASPWNRFEHATTANPPAVPRSPTQRRFEQSTVGRPVQSAPGSGSTGTLRANGARGAWARFNDNAGVRPFATGGGMVRAGSTIGAPAIGHPAPLDRLPATRPVMRYEPPVRMSHPTTMRAPVRIVAPERRSTNDRSTQSRETTTRRR
ncbi:MAG: DUF6600 domain-containing protein [Vulcanimicrobiaceae bacterium]